MKAIAIISSHTTSLFWFRMDMMREFKRKGYAVVALSSDSEAEWSEKFEAEGISYVQISVARNGLNPLNDVKTYRSIKSVLARVRPDKIFVYQAKTIAYGCLAARALGMTEIYPMVAGLGSIFRGVGFKNSLLRWVMGALYKRAFACSKRVMFQNFDDRDELIDLGLLPLAQCAIINGSGVNLDKFSPTPMPDSPTFLYVGRLIRDKGVFEYLEACRRIKIQFPELRCLLIGPFDTNPSALTEDELKPFFDAGVVEYLGELKDVRPYLDLCTSYILPSYHEGTPKSVIEAMAKGRAIITSDAPGCRETVRDGVNGFLIPVKDIDALTERMAYLVQHPDICKRMGAESLAIARAKYDVNIVNASILKVMNIN